MNRVTYTPRGQKLRETKANGNTVDHTYFLDGLLKTEVEKKANGTLVSSHTLAYDPNGHRTSDAAKRMNADNHAAYLDHVFAYTYDPRDRIRQVTKSAAGGGVLETESYTHDANNNVITQTVDNATTNFKYDRNRLLTAGGAAEPPASAGQLRVEILGPLTVAHRGLPVEVGRGKRRSLLALFGLQPGQVVSRDEFLDVLWGV